MKKIILETIYSAFENWSSNQSFYCRKGCSTCCTQNVTITTLEGTRILEYCISINRRAWLLDKLNNSNGPGNPQQTTNEYILANIQGNEAIQSTNPVRGKCSFLEGNCCTIYPVRPFSCRCFASETLCDDHESATVTDPYLYGSIVAMQLIEHLGQFEQWGYMTDVLSNLIHSKEYDAFNTDESCYAQNSPNNVRVAQPLPGYYIPPEYEEQITPLLRAIFDTHINGKTVEQIFNGR